MRVVAMGDVTASSWPWKRHMVQVLLSNAKTVSIAVSVASTRVGDIGIAKSTLQARSSTSSTFAYAAVCELVARRSARCAPSAKPMTPILSAL